MLENQLPVNNTPVKEDFARIENEARTISQSSPIQEVLDLGRAWGHFFVTGDAFFAGFLPVQPGQMTSQNTRRMILTDALATPAAIVVEEAGFYKIDYVLGTPESSPGNINSYCIAINQAANGGVPVPYPGSKISSPDLQQIMGGTIIAELPAGGEIQLRSTQVLPSLVHSWELDSVSVSITVHKVSIK